MNGDSIDLKPLLEIQQSFLLQSQNPNDWMSSLLDCLSIVVAIITAIATGITAYIAYKALMYAKKEYELQKRIKESETLSAYNQRYSTDQHISKVLYSFQQTPYDFSKLKVNDKEMFLRFFEELQLTIENGGLPEEVIYDMFAYYAIKADDEGRKFVDDYETENWTRFRRFAKRMKAIKKKRNQRKTKKERMI